MTDRVQRLLDRVPGYTGYRDKERRRDEDERVRVAVADSIDQSAAKVQEAGRALANARQMQDIQAVESLFQRITLFSGKIRHATYGYAGLFDDAKVDDAALDQLGRFDRQMGTELTALDQAAGAVLAAGSDPGAIGKSVSSANGELSRLQTLWNGRSSVISSGQPTSDQRALALLETPAQSPATVAVPGLRPGAALSIQGDNFIVDGTMDITGSSQTLNLARIGPGDWLLQATGAVVVSARLKEIAKGSTGTAGGAQRDNGRCTITNRDGTTRSTAVAFSMQTSNTNDAAVSVEIDFGDETRTMTGNKIAADDVEIYGQPAQ